MRLAATRSSSKAGSGVPGTAAVVAPATMGPKPTLIRSIPSPHFREALHERARQGAATADVLEPAARDADEAGGAVAADQAIEQSVGLLLDRLLGERPARIPRGRDHAFAPCAA